VNEKDTNTLKKHYINVTDTFYEQYLSLKISASHFTPILIEEYNHDTCKWKPLDQVKSFYKKGEMMQLAMQTLYYLNIETGECIVQRGKEGKLFVYAIKKLNERINAPQSSSELTFGADIEGLLFHNKDKKWITASSVIKESNTIGFDSSIIIQNHKVKNHILEFRPEAASNSEQFISNIKSCYDELSKKTKPLHLKVIGGANPLKQIFLGGHLHIGNQPLTFHHVRVLDIFFGLPLALIDTCSPQNRRKSYGRLGSVKKNKFNGFEYRTLSSWIHLVPIIDPVIEWFVFIQKNSAIFPYLHFLDQQLLAYYNHDKKALKEETKRIEMITYTLMNSDDDKKIAQHFFQWIYLVEGSNGEEKRGNML
jgi:hypothetical protein